MSVWSTARVSEIANRIVIGPFGSRLKADVYTSEGVPVVRGTNLTGGKTLGGEWVYVSDKTADELASCNVIAGDLVFPHRGAIGEVGIVPGDRARYMLSTSLMMLRCDAKRAHAPYLYYFFKSSPGRHELLKNASQVGTPGIGQPLTSLKGIEVPLPPLAVQRRIAEVLSGLDDKIELNRRMSQTLEAIAQAIFKSWFVDFEPALAKGQGDSSESICRRFGLLEDELTRFPNRLQLTDAGLTPEGWHTQPIGKLIDIVGGSTPNTKEPSYWIDGVYDWATPKDLSALDTPALLGTERRISEAGLAQIGSGLLPKDTVLLSSRAPIGYRAIAEVPVAINQGFIAMKPREEIPSVFLLRWLESVHDEIVSRANGSTFLEISKAAFRPIKMVVPPSELLHAFRRIAEPLYRQVVANEQAARALRECRNALLPKLLTGELPIGRVVEETAA